MLGTDWDRTDCDAVLGTDWDLTGSDAMLGTDCDPTGCDAMLGTDCGVRDPVTERRHEKCGSLGNIILC